MSIAAWIRIGLVMAVVAAIGGGLWWFGEARYADGEAAADQRWKAAEADALAAAAAARAENQRLANRSSSTHEADRARIERALQETDRAFQAALRASTACPPELGDLVIPAAVLRGLHVNAGRPTVDGDRPAASEPDAALR